MNIVPIEPTGNDRVLPLPQKQTILVVDDHPALCDVAKILLTRCGYRVITAQDPLQAKELARQNLQIDLLLTDVEMPGMMGDQLAEWFRTINPRAAVIFMSGNSMQRLRLKEHAFIEKPFVHLDALVRIIGETLAQKRNARQTVAAAAA